MLCICATNLVWVADTKIVVGQRNISLADQRGSLTQLWVPTTILYQHCKNFNVSPYWEISYWLQPGPFLPQLISPSERVLAWVASLFWTKDRIVPGRDWEVPCSQRGIVVSKSNKVEVGPGNNTGQWSCMTQMKWSTQTNAVMLYTVLSSTVYLYIVYIYINMYILHSSPKESYI